MKFPPTTDLWVCKHQYSYPDICPQCKEKRMESPIEVGSPHSAITVYVWANSIEEAIMRLFKGHHHSSRKEALNEATKPTVKEIVERNLTIWEIIIRRIPK